MESTRQAVLSMSSINEICRQIKHEIEVANRLLLEDVKRELNAFKTEMRQQSVQLGLAIATLLRQHQLVYVHIMNITNLLQGQPIKVVEDARSIEELSTPQKYSPKNPRKRARQSDLDKRVTAFWVRECVSFKESIQQSGLSTNKITLAQIRRIEAGKLYYTLHDRLRQALQVDASDTSDKVEIAELLDKKITSWCQNYELSEWSEAVHKHKKHFHHSQESTSASQAVSQVEEGINVALWGYKTKAAVHA